jgi:hypothetical protein
MLTSRAGIRDPASYKTPQSVKNSIDEQKLNGTVALADLAWLGSLAVEGYPCSSVANFPIPGRRSMTSFGTLDAQEDLQCSLPQYSRVQE